MTLTGTAPERSSRPICLREAVVLADDQPDELRHGQPPDRVDAAACRLASSASIRCLRRLQLRPRRSSICLLALPVDLGLLLRPASLRARRPLRCSRRARPASWPRPRACFALASACSLGLLLLGGLLGLRPPSRAARRLRFAPSPAPRLCWPASRAFSSAFGRPRRRAALDRCGGVDAGAARLRAGAAGFGRARRRVAGGVGVGDGRRGRGGGRASRRRLRPAAGAARPPARASARRDCAAAERRRRRRQRLLLRQRRQERLRHAAAGSASRRGELFGRISGVIITTSSVWFFCAALLLNSRPRIGMSPMPGIFCSVDVHRVVHQAGDGERLAVLQLELGLGAARASAPGCGSRCSTTALAKSSVLTSGRTFRCTRSPFDRRREVQADAELLELRR